jgi:Bardet-Biedl syndrome 5 protein
LPPRALQESIKIKEHGRFGATLVMRVSDRGGGHLFGFRVDPPERLAALEKEVTALRDAAAMAPDFGVNVAVEGDVDPGVGSALSGVTEDVEVTDASDTHGAGGDAYAAYLAEGTKEGDRPVVFSAELGLAIESPPTGLSISQLWTSL